MSDGEQPAGAPPAVLRNADAEYVAYTSQTSTVARSLMLSAIAIAWFFAGRGSDGDATASTVFHRVQEHAPLAIALWLSIAGLLIDLSQYAFGAVLWGAYRWMWRTVLFNDDPRFKGSNQAARAWRMAERWNVVATINAEVPPDEADQSTPRAGISAQANRAATSLHSATGNRMTSTSWSPPFLNGITTVLFAVKIVLTLGSYVALLVAATV